jgi:hypothetical protein
MLVVLGSIASKQTNGTHTIDQAITQLLNYALAHPGTTIRYHASELCLHIHSDASYLSEANTHIRAGGTLFLSAKPADPTKNPSADAPPSVYNGAIHTISAIMANVMASATEAEFGALFHNALAIVPLRTTPPSWKWGIHNRKPPSRQTMTAPRALLMKLSSSDAPKQ